VSFSGLKTKIRFW